MKENYVPGDYIAEDLTWLAGRGSEKFPGRNFLSWDLLIRCMWEIIAGKKYTKHESEWKQKKFENQYHLVILMS